MANYVVTFARGFGSGGKAIASKLAADLGIHCYENRILTLASQMSGLDEKLFNEVNEKIRTNGSFASLLRGLQDPDSIFREMKSLYRTINCLTIRNRSLKI